MLAARRDDVWRLFRALALIALLVPTMLGAPTTTSTAEQHVARPEARIAAPMPPPLDPADEADAAAAELGVLGLATLLPLPPARDRVIAWVTLDGCRPGYRDRLLRPPARRAA